MNPNNIYEKTKRDADQILLKSSKKLIKVFINIKVNDYSWQKK